jgi:putative resolvase
MSREYTITEAAQRMRRSVKTLQRWDRQKTLVARRTTTGRRVYTQDQIETFLGIVPPATQRAVVAYCRVSSQTQRPDLKNQRQVIEAFCAARGIAGVEFIEEIGGGLNFKRPQFLQVIDRLLNREITTLILAHQDRLARFGCDLLWYLCKRYDCEVLLLNNEQLSPEQEMVQDLMTITHSFSARVYGLRNYRKALKQALAGTA